MKKILLFCLTISVSFIKAQDINIGNQGASLYDCSTNGVLYDSGGSGASYSSGESFVLTICPTVSLPGGTPIALELDTTYFGHQNDFLAVYDGAGTVNSADLITSFSQTSFQSAGSIYRTTITNTSGCITVQFVSDATSPGGDVALNLLCLPPCKSVIANTPASSIPVDTFDLTYIHHCSTEPIVFTGSGTYDTTTTGYTQSDATSSFYWDFGAAGYNTGQVVSQPFAPGIYPIKLIVEDASGCQSVNEIDLSVRQAIMPNVNFTPVDTTFCLANLDEVTAYLISTSSEILHFGDTAAFDTLKIQTSVVIQDTSYLPDDSDNMSGNGITTPAIFEFPIFGYLPGATLSNINDLLYVCIDIEHSFIGDLDIILECPNGQSVALVDFSPPGTAGWDLGEPDAFGTNQGVPYTYCWSPFANIGDSIADGNSANIAANLIGPNNGAVDTSIMYNASSNAWNNFIGCPLNGDWTIKVFDDYGGDDGYVFGAAIAFEDSFALEQDTFLVFYSNPLWDVNSQIISPLNNDSILVQASFSPFQTLTFNFEDNLGCEWEAEYDGIDVSTFSVTTIFADTTLCQEDSLTISAVVDNAITSCNYSIEMIDNFGDGWNGNEVNVYIDGVLFGTYTVDVFESDYSNEIITVSNGELIEFEYDNSNGSFNSEVNFNVLNSDGDTIFTSGFDPSAGILFTSIVNCNGLNTYSWSPPSEIITTNNNQAVIYPTEDSEYTVVVTNEFGCSNVATSTVIFDSSNSPVIDFGAAPVQFCCTGTELPFDLSDYVFGQPISHYEIEGQVDSFINISSSDFIDDTLTYTFYALAENGCESTQTLDFYRNCIEPSIDVIDTIYVGDSENFIINTVNQYDSMSFVWSTTDISTYAIKDTIGRSAVFNGVVEGDFTANATVTAYFRQNDGTFLNCPEEADGKPYRVEGILKLSYPNAFTPNGDDINNIFRPIKSEFSEVIDFRVYNRWGDKVYDIANSDNKEGWDGTYRGEAQPSDVYMYFISIKTFEEIVTTEGSLSLIR